MLIGGSLEGDYFKLLLFAAGQSKYAEEEAVGDGDDQDESFTMGGDSDGRMTSKLLFSVYYNKEPFVTIYNG
jgi:hypothetical protein